MIIFAFLLGVSTAATPLDEKEKTQFKELVSQRLNDPDSALFRWPANRPGRVYCGWVNAKNRFGGYVGYRLFSITRPAYGFGDLLLRTAEDEISMTLSDCRSAGFDVSAPPPAALPAAKPQPLPRAHPKRR